MKTPDSSPSPAVSRRNFVRRAAAAAVLLPLVRVTPGLHAAEPKSATAPSEAGKLVAAPGATTWSKPGKVGTVHVFSKPLQHLSYAETAALLAETGYSGIDLPVRANGHVLPEKVDEDLPRAIEAAHKAGLKIEMITTDIVSVQSKLAEPVLRAAAKHGVKFYRLGNLPYDAKLGVMESLQKLKAQFRELAQLNASLGVHGAYQNHSGTRVGSPVWDLYELLRELDPRAIGVQFDIRHATTEGGQSWPLGLKLLAPWIKCTDVKDFKWAQSPGKATVEGTALGEGIVPLDAYFKLYRELGIEGPISVHLEYPPFERGPKFETPAEQRAVFVTALKKDSAVLAGLLKKHSLA